jgi:hypothetical protein
MDWRWPSLEEGECHPFTFSRNRVFAFSGLLAACVPHKFPLEGMRSSVFKTYNCSLMASHLLSIKVFGSIVNFFRESGMMSDEPCRRCPVGRQDHEED